MLQVRVLYRPSDLTLPNAGYARNPSLMVHAGQCARIRFEKNGGDLGPPAGFPRLRIQKYSAARSAPASGPSVPCFFEVCSADARIRHTVSPLTRKSAVYRWHYHSSNQRVIWIVNNQLVFLSSSRWIRYYLHPPGPQPADDGPQPPPLDAATNP